MKKLLLVPVLLIGVMCFSQSKSPVVKLVNPSSVSTPKGYSHAAVVDLGTCKMIILSGQVALDKQGKLVGEHDIEKQTEQVFINIKSIVEELGGTMDNIVKLGYFVKDVGQLPAIRSVRDKFINTDNPPASTLVQIEKLFREDVLIEIEATAVIPKR